MLQIFATKALSRLERSRQWSAFTGADHVEIDDDREASLRGSDLGRVRLCHVSMGRHRVVQDHVAHGLSEAPTLKFFFQEEGVARMRQNGRTIQVGAGQWCAVRKDLPHEIDAPAQSRQLTITLPCEAIPMPRPGFDWWGTPRSYLLGVAQILHASATASVLTGGSLSDRECELIGVQIAQLIEMTLRAGDLGPAPDIREKRRLAALDHIERHLSDPDLSVASIARALGCSSRTVHKLFEGERHTVARAIWDRRLDRCKSELIDPAMAGRSITEIAHFWGFSDSQHFSRAFKNRFGRTPREYRGLAILN